MELKGVEYRPYIMGYPRFLGGFLERCPLDDVLTVDIFEPECMPFFRLVNAGNNQAFSGLGMPPWVQLDCCTMPSAMIGFAARREDVSRSLWTTLRQQTVEQYGKEAADELEGYDGWVPVSEYCGLSAPEPNTIIGISLFSLIRGVGMGVRTKALALRCYGADHQIGMTQYANPAIRTHTAFGPMRILHARAAPHSLPDETFVYSLELGDDALLDQIIAGGTRGDLPEYEFDLEVPIEVSGMTDVVAGIIEEHGPVAIVAPGFLSDDERQGKVLLLKKATPLE